MLFSHWKMLLCIQKCYLWIYLLSNCWWDSKFANFASYLYVPYYMWMKRCTISFLTDAKQSAVSLKLVYIPSFQRNFSFWIFHLKRRYLVMRRNTKINGILSHFFIPIQHSTECHIKQTITLFVRLHLHILIYLCFEITRL